MRESLLSEVPVIDVAPLVGKGGDRARAAEELGRACRDCGFFYARGHGVDDALQARLEAASRRFFALDETTKGRIAMARGGRAWRGYFPVGGELTSGRPDAKEGIYFGAELPPEDARVKAGRPLHGANLFPDEVPELRSIVLAYLDAMTRLGHALTAGIALSLGLDERYFIDRYTADPLILFRIFHYPPVAPAAMAESWGVGEHTDYGLLTILKQDDNGGLQVKGKAGWIEAPPIPGTFVCNLGDMLDRMTGGRYRSTPHRVKKSAKRGRLSFPFFFDPSFDAEVKALPVTGHAPRDDKEERWDKASVHDFRGTYGEYLLGKVAKVFPQLKAEVLK